MNNHLDKHLDKKFGKRPVTRKKLSETVAEDLEQMIRSGEFNEGEHLPSERELVDIFAVGRPSIREALSSLARRGLVKLSSGEKALVTRPSPEQIIAELSGMSRDFLSQPSGMVYFEQLRMFFEASLVRYAAEHATESDLSRLEEALAENKLSVGDPEQFRRTDIYFHRVIAEIPDNPIFLAIHNALVEWLMLERPWLGQTDESHQLSYEHHADLLGCIQKQDVEGADAALQVHLKHAVDHYVGKI